MRTAVIAGTFDVENYGDCLFPIVAAHRLAQSDFQVVSVSPTNNATRWKDSLRPKSVPSLFHDDFQFTGALIGGGNIIHNRTDELRSYVDAGLTTTAYSSLFAGVSLAAALRNRPVVWNSPGVPKQFSEAEQRGLIPALVSLSAYTSVRDEISRDYLGTSASKRITVVPDTAVEISRAWPRRELESHFHAIVARTQVAGDRGFVSIHVKERALQQEVKLLAGMIDSLSLKTGLQPVLLALAPCHGDDATARSLSNALTCPHILLDETESLKEIAAAIAFSECYAGSSLHGYITSYSYGRPGLIVADPPLPKFAGFLKHVGREQDMVPSWQAAFSIVESRPDIRTSGLPANVQAALDQHWQKISRALTSEQDLGHTTNFLKFALTSGIQGDNLSWLLQPHLASMETTVGWKSKLKAHTKAATRQLPFGKRLLSKRRAIS